MIEGGKKEVGEKLSVNLSTCMRAGTRVIVFRSALIRHVVRSLRSSEVGYLLFHLAKHPSCTRDRIER